MTAARSRWGRLTTVSNGINFVAQLMGILARGPLGERRRRPQRLHPPGLSEQCSERVQRSVPRVKSAWLVGIYTHVLITGIGERKRDGVETLLTE